MPALQDSHELWASFATLPLPRHGRHSPPSDTLPAEHVRHSDTTVQAAIGHSVPAPHTDCWHAVLSLATTYPSWHTWHTPIVEYCCSSHSWHAYLEQTDTDGSDGSAVDVAQTGPYPAAHGVHDVCSASVMKGYPHSIHSPPSGEYVSPVQSTHAVLSAFGAWLGRHREHVVRSAFTTLGASHAWQTPICEYCVPVHSTHPSRSAVGPCKTNNRTAVRLLQKVLGQV
eukprot:SAG22_NODE_381_length_11354_cov_6.529631_5_plen_227_part_00